MDAAAEGASGVSGDYTPPPPVEYPVPAAPISVPGWNNVAYAGTVDGVYRLIAGVRDWYRITPKVEPFDSDADLAVF